MNKQELIKEYENIVKDDSLELCGCYNMADKIFMRKIYKSVLEDLEQLDEPQKVTVPQFVADWIEKNKGSLFGLNYDSVSSEIYDWVYEEEGNLKKLHLACAIGYTVEKEKQYTVKMKNLRALFCYLAYIPDEGYWSLMASGGESIIIKHTRKELEEAGFGDVFNSPLFEVKEVEE